MPSNLHVKISKFVISFCSFLTKVFLSSPALPDRPGDSGAPALLVPDSSWFFYFYYFFFFFTWTLFCQSDRPTDRPTDSKSGNAIGTKRKNTWTKERITLFSIYTWHLWAYSNERSLLTLVLSGVILVRSGSFKLVLIRSGVSAHRSLFLSFLFVLFRC